MMTINLSPGSALRGIDDARDLVDRLERRERGPGFNASFLQRFRLPVCARQGFLALAGVREGLADDQDGAAVVVRPGVAAVRRRAGRRGAGQPVRVRAPGEIDRDVGAGRTRGRAVNVKRVRFSGEGVNIHPRTMRGGPPGILLAPDPAPPTGNVLHEHDLRAGGRRRSASKRDNFDHV